MKNDIVVANAAFNAAVDDETISVESASIITVNENVLAGMNGLGVDDIEVSEVVLVTVVIDDSASIDFRNLRDAFIEGQNELVNALADSKEADNIMFAQAQMNTGVMHSYVPVKDAIMLERANFAPDHGTPLYDSYVDGLAANIAYAQMLKETGTPVKNIFIIITDGEDTTSRSKSEKQCYTLTRDLLASEQFVIGFIGAGNDTNFREVAKNMGIPDGSILEVDATASAIRGAFKFASKSAIKVSTDLIDPNAQNGFFN